VFMLLETVRPKVAVISPAYFLEQDLVDCARAAKLSHRFTYYDCIASIPNSISALKFLKRLLNKEEPHESVLEHSMLKVCITCSRIASHQIVRHRHTGYTQTSTKAVPPMDKKGKVTFISPDLGVDSQFNLGVYDEDTFSAAPDWLVSAYYSVDWYYDLLKKGVSKEKARYILPGCSTTNLFMSTNFREWRRIINLRTAPDASPEVQYIFTLLLTLLPEEIRDLLTYNNKEVL
jgi:thymidylate synthase (FAD)